MLLPDPGRAGENNIVSARSGDLERALDRVLPHDVREIEGRAARRRRGRRETGRKRAAPVQVGEQVVQAGRRQHGDAGGIGGLGRVLLWDKYRSEAGVPHGERHRKCAAHRTQLAGQGQLAEKDGVLRQGIDLARGRKDGKQNRKVIGGAGLFGIRGSEVDRQAGNRPVEAAGFDCGAHTLPSFADRAGR